MPRKYARWPRGSSPRVWGTVIRLVEIGDGCRFIPTCVGNGLAAGAWSAVGSVHPHVCGERPPKVLAQQARFGSSPRVWGTACRVGDCRGRFRFIPTCVGNGNLASGCPCSLAVHPHVCGEREDKVEPRKSGSGSSPRVWGTASSRRSPSGRWRFIPTCVGNGISNGSPHIARTVHPHVCGERRSLIPLSSPSIGSFPRVWGTVIRLVEIGDGCRFIPTCVGNGLAAGAWSAVGSVHPHVCGER